MTTQESETPVKWFKIHLLLYGVAAAFLAGINLFWLTGEPWFVVFMVAWGAPLAGHCGYAMGLFQNGKT